ncbi:MAG TPA: beta-ketoacyl-ACP synthase 3 [Nitrospira sp.]|nr:beta-ketoacyl-ACP synthase 3 [Nitrospira sp.]
MIRTRIIGTGSYVPERVVSNEEVGGPLGIGPELAFQLTGIRERRRAADREASSDLAVAAARSALDAAGIPASSIQAILVSTTSPDTIFPSTACYVQSKLGCRGVAAFDLAASCSGFLYGLSMADAMIRSKQIEQCLVVAAEVKSRMVDGADPDTALLFGDGAGAAVLRKEDVEGHPHPGILGIHLHADGSRHDLVRIPAGGSSAPATRDSLRQAQHAMRMRGAPLFRLAVKKLEQSIRETLKEFGIGVEELAQVVLHQANGRILSLLTDRLGVSPSKICTVIERYGNTSSASLPIALDHAVRSAKIARHDLVLLGSFGGGIAWATGLVRW